VYLLCVLGWVGLRPVASWALVAVPMALLFPLTSSIPTFACLCLRLVVECMYAISCSMLRRLCVRLLSSRG
jgi:hypothetical protein